MDWIWTFVVWCICLSVPAAVVLRCRRNASTGRLPPGPPGWPVFGNMFDLGREAHKSIGGLRHDYGPVVWLRLGSVNTVALLTAKAAAELFKNHDSDFADRRITNSMEAQGFSEGSVSLSRYGPHWRLKKRIVTMELLGHKMMGEAEPVRRRCISDMVEWVRKAGAGGRTIDVGRLAFLASFNMVGNLMLSRDLVSPECEGSSEMFKAVDKLLEGSGNANIADLFPWLKWLDPQGLRRALDRGMKRNLEIIAGFVLERRLNHKRGASTTQSIYSKDYLDVLLEHQGNGVDEPRKISDHGLNIFILELFFGGTEPASSMVEWAMVELLKHPEAMNEAKRELGEVVGKGNEFQEIHLEKLPYLQAVVKETTRLHPPVPFLVPRRAIREITDFMGYRIPKDTQLFVNAWAIGRDPECWDDPHSFKPERFLGSEIDYKGLNYELIPFGAGRRKCAGIALGHRMLHLMLGSLVHEFEWRVDDNGLEGLMDTREVLRVTAKKLVPLEAIISRGDVEYDHE